MDKETPKTSKHLRKALDAIRQRTFQEEVQPISFLENLVNAIRPKKIIHFETAVTQFDCLLAELESDSNLLSRFQEIIDEVFKNTNIEEILTFSGIIEEAGFFSEVRKRIENKMLPPLKKEGSFFSIIDTLFRKSNDYQWVNEIPHAAWEKLFNCLNFKPDIKNEKFRKEIFLSLELIGAQLTALSISKSIRRSFDSMDELAPFREQARIIQIIILTDGQCEECENLKDELLKELYKCEQIIVKIRALNDTNGTSIRQTHTLMQLSQYINRIHLILSFLGSDQHIDYNRLVSYMKLLIENENTKNHLGRYLNQSLSFVAYRIAEHGRNTGEHYITNNRQEYNSMFRSASKGGIIVSFVVLIKCLLHAVKFAPFWQGFAYSLNYAVGFVTIHATGSTLATKQPAMTASAIASIIDRKDRHIDMAKLSILIAKVVRSQTISFIGNLLLVFPLTLLIALFFDKVLDAPLANHHFAQQMLDDQNPIKSLCLLYACFTGFFLFISGLISGYFDNFVLYSKMPQRLQEHHFLKRIFSKKKLEKISGYFNKNMGAIMGNVSLGFFLGMASFVGYIFGLPFDIRHITISTGYYAIGLYTLFPDLALSDVILTGIGVILIGLLNFLVSFSLSFMVALSSRKIQFKKYRSLGIYLFSLFKKYPKDFFFPPKKPRLVEDFIPKKEKENKS